MTGLSWRWVFFVNLPLGVVAVVFGLVALRRQDVERPGRLDLPGLVLSAAGLGGLLYAVGAGPQVGWGSLQVLLAGAGGVVLLVVLVVVQLRTAQPLLRLRLLAQPLFRAVNVVILLGNAAFFGALFVIALLLQDGLGLSARAAGACMLAEALTVALGAQLASRVLYPRWGPRRLLVTGLGGVALACAPMALIDDRGHLVGELVLLAVLGLSWSQVFIPATATAFVQVADADTAQASTLFSATRQVGSAVGVAVLSTVVALVAPGSVTVRRRSGRRPRSGSAPTTSPCWWRRRWPWPRRRPLWRCATPTRAPSPEHVWRRARRLAQAGGAALVATATARPRVCSIIVIRSSAWLAAAGSSRWGTRRAVTQTTSRWVPVPAGGLTPPHPEAPMLLGRWAAGGGQARPGGARADVEPADRGGDVRHDPVPEAAEDWSQARVGERLAPVAHAEAGKVKAAPSRPAPR